MTEEPDYYAILQVDPLAEKEIIEAAYRRLAVKYHPDLDHSPGATERMKLINAAYQVLSNSEKRRAYDLSRGVRPGRGPTPLRTSLGQRYVWWILLAALIIMVVSLRFNARFFLPIGFLFLLIWFVWLRRTWRR